MSKPFYVVKEKRWCVVWKRATYWYLHQRDAEALYEKHKDEV